MHRHDRVCVSVCVLLYALSWREMRSLSRAHRILHTACRSAVQRVSCAHTQRLCPEIAVTGRLRLYFALVGFFAIENRESIYPISHGGGCDTEGPGPPAHMGRGPQAGLWNMWS